VSEVDKDALGPLRTRVPPVSGFLFLKKGRFEASPGLTVSAKDAFFTKYMPGVSLTYYVTETVGISARAAYGFNLVSGAAQICEEGVNGKCVQPCFSQSDRSDCLDKYISGRAPGQIGLIGGVDVQWAPIYG